MKTVKRRRELVISLTGGLGNQLFSFFAGLYFARILDRELIVDLGSVDKSHTQGQYDISSFDIKSKFVNERNVSSVLISLRNKLVGGRLKIPFVDDVLKVLFGDFLFMPGFDDIENANRVLGSMKPALLKRKRIKIGGYFADLRYLDEIFIESDFLQIKNPTKWFIENLKLLEIESSFASLHLRLGDFEQNSSSVGLLSAHYYNQAILEYRKIYPDMKLFVFSDDISGAKKLLSELNLSSIHYLSTPENSDPAESIVLMSKAKVAILSNSTFGFMGAKLGSTKNLVIYPFPLHRDAVLEIRGIPTEWKPMESVWR